MQLLIIIFRTLFFYFFVSFSYRIMGKREVGQLGIIDLIVSILVAELVAISIENTNQPIFLTIFPILILVLLEILLAYLSIKSRRFRVLFQGKPSMIICDGKINYHELINQRYSLDDLLLNLRQNKIKSISDVEYAFLEANGRLSVFPYDETKPKKMFPLPIILDGKIDGSALSKTPFSSKEIYSMLYDKNIDISNVFYGFYQNKKIFIIEKNNKNTFLNNKYLEK